MSEVLREQQNFNNKDAGYLSNVPSKKTDQMNTLDNHYVQSSMNKSYEKLMAETIEPQMTGGNSGNNYYQSKMY